LDINIDEFDYVMKKSIFSKKITEASSDIYIDPQNVQVDADGNEKEAFFVKRTIVDYDKKGNVIEVLSLPYLFSYTMDENEYRTLWEGSIDDIRDFTASNAYRILNELRGTNWIKSNEVLSTVLNDSEIDLLDMYCLRINQYFKSG